MQALQPPYPELVVAGLAALREFYGDGRKMVVRRCRTKLPEPILSCEANGWADPVKSAPAECGWDAGFYFNEDGMVRYDAGCWCTANAGTNPSDEGWIALLIVRSPAWLKRRIDEGRWWEERKRSMHQAQWEALPEVKVEERQRRREKIHRQRVNSEFQADLFGPD